MIIIGDVAGQFDCLMRLVAKFPKDEKIIFVGDLVDRGPKSKEVVQWVIDNGHDCVMGNHEDFMVDFYRNEKFYGDSIWFMNGGDKTAQSYLGHPIYTNKGSHHDLVRNAIPESHIIWMENLPTEIRYEKEKLIVTHAPYMSTNDQADKIWNRNTPEQVDGYFNIFGHNSHWGLQNIDGYAMCIDTSRQEILTGVQWPSMTIYQEPYETK